MASPPALTMYGPYEPPEDLELRGQMEADGGYYDDEPVTGQLHDLKGRQLRPLSLQEVASVIHQEIYDSLGDLDSEISEQRRKSLQYYLGKPFGNEQEGHSKVILLDTLETVEWILPTLMRMFFGGSRVVRYKPKIPYGANAEQISRAERHAELATAYVNSLFMDEMDGFLICHNWFKDALLEKNGVVKAYIEERYEPEIHTYQELSAEEIAILTERGDLEIVGMNQYTKIYYHPQIDLREHREVFDVRVRRVTPHAQVKVDNVPPEEFLIARRSVKLNDQTPFSAHRKKMSCSDLISLGYPADFILSLPSDDTPEWSLQRTERFEEDETYPYTTGERADPASRMIWVNECYVRIDEDGDGFTELRKILCVGDSSITIIDDDEINRNPFCSITPIPMPHKYHGLSLADIVMDLQLIRSTILRQLLDNMYVQTNQRVVVTDGVEIEDLLTSRPGGVIRADTVDSVKVLETPSLSRDAYELLDRLQDTRENRTGVTRYNQGLDAKSLNQTAFGINSIMSAAGARMELIARIFAETGMKDLFRKLLRLVIEGPVKDRVVRLRGEWVSIDPSEWNGDMDVEVEVGLGVGQAQERMEFLKQIAELQDRVGQIPGMADLLLTPQHIFRTAAKITETMGFKNPEMFFANPGNQPFPERQPDPKMVTAQSDVEFNKQKNQLEAQKLELEAKRLEQMHQRETAELALNRELELARIASQERIALAQVGAQLDANDRAENDKKEAA